MKKFLIIFLVLTLALGGCATRATAPAAESTAVPGAQPTPEATPEPTPEATPAPLESCTPEMLAAYAAALRGVYEDHVYPDGADCGYDGVNPIEDNRFAVYDVDGDGADELILTFTTSYMAGMGETVYGYDAATGALQKELAVFPAVTYFANGLARADWSHNQGLAPNYWPYTLYAYDAAQDVYAEIAQVDGWERAVCETNYEGEPFPEEIDTQGVGVVFYVTERGETRTVSASALAQWEAAQGLNEAAQEPAYQALTAENIAALEQ